MHFGEHLTIDGYGGDESLLNDREHISKTIEDLCLTLAMKRLSEITVLEAPGNDIKDPGGWSAFVVIAESHVSLHTFPRRKFISADVYTCKNGLDVGLVLDSFREKFKLQDIEKNFVLRGTRYPNHDIT